MNAIPICLLAFSMEMIMNLLANNVRPNIIALVMACLLSSQAYASVSSPTDSCQFSHWRDKAYDNKIMIQYKPYSHCIEWTAWQFQLPEELLYSVIYHERGDVSGKKLTNRNATTDCGPGGINDVRMPELAKFDLTRNDICTVPCRSIWAVGYLLRYEIDRAKGDFWLGVGNYHANQRLKPKTHAIYVRKIYAAWKNLIGIMKRCS